MLDSVVEPLHNPRTALRLPNQGEQECFHVNQWLNTATFVNNRLTEMVKRIRFDLTRTIRVERNMWVTTTRLVESKNKLVSRKWTRRYI